VGKLGGTGPARAHFFVSAVCLLARLLSLSPCASAGPISAGYQITDLGVFPGPYEGATWTGASASGVFIGSVPYENGDRQPPTQPAAWINGQFTLLAPSYEMGAASAVNASGQIVGTISDYDSGTTSNPRYFLYSGGTLTDLGNFGSSAAGDITISNNGQIAAGVVAPNGSSSVIVDNGGTIVQVPAAVPGASMEPTAINNAGQVIGFMNSPTGNGQGFFYFAGKTIELPGLQGSSGAFTNEPLALSSNGIVVGIAYAPNSLQGQSPSYVYQNGVMSRIPEYGGNYFIPASVNSQGIVLGSAPIGSSFTSFQPLLYNSATGVFTPLSALMPAGSAWTLDFGISINDQGQILARATENGVEHLVELSPDGLGNPAPVPEPGSLLVFGLIACAVAFRHRAFGRRG
jgi:probable HAF family extracellular repeat protein